MEYIVNFNKNSYTYLCKKEAKLAVEVSVLIPSVTNTGAVCIEIQSNSSCSFDDGKRKIIKDFGFEGDSKTVNFKFNLKCSQKKIYHPDIYAYTVNENGKKTSRNDTASVHINCE